MSERDKKTREAGGSQRFPVRQPHDDGPHSWNYRVRRFEAFTGVPGVEPQEQYEVIEVFYDADGEPMAWGNCLGAVGDDLDGLRRDLAAMTAALAQPVIDHDDLPGRGDD